MLASAFPAEHDEQEGDASSPVNRRGSLDSSSNSTSQLLAGHFHDGNKCAYSRKKANSAAHAARQGRGSPGALRRRIALATDSVLRGSLTAPCCYAKTGTRATHVHTERVELTQRRSGLKFDMWWNRKHHCRHCGRIFCQSCSSRSLMLPMEFSVREPQRVCDECAAELEPIQDELIRTCSNQTRIVEVAPKANYFSPVSFSLTAELQKAAASLDRILARTGSTPVELDRTLPLELIRGSKGLAFLTIFKGGFLLSGKVGTGLVVIRRPDGSWSAPSAIGTMGIGWGAQIGGEITDFVGVLMTEDAVDAFSGQGQLAVGAEVGLSVGPVGRDGSASLNFAERGPAAVYSYTTSQGLFAGVSLEGAVIKSRDDVNLRFYGREMAPEEILNQLPQPLAAQCLYRAIDRAFHSTAVV